MSAVEQLTSATPCPQCSQQPVMTTGDWYTSPATCPSAERRYRDEIDGLASAAFWCLDARTRFLIGVAEHALLELEADLAEALQTPTIRLMWASHHQRPVWGSYRMVLGALQATAVASYAASFIACLTMTVTR